MAEPAVKQRLRYAKNITYRALRLNYEIIFPFPSGDLFDFFSMDNNGIKLTRVELDSFSNKVVKKEILEHKKNYPQIQYLRFWSFRKMVTDHQIKWGNKMGT